MPLKTTTVYLDAGVYRELQRLAEERGVSAALVLREAAADYVATHASRPRPRSIGVGRSQKGDVGRNAEKYLRGMGR